MKMLRNLVVLFCVLVLMTVSNAVFAADYTANTKQPVLTEALNRLEAMNNRKVLNVIQGQNTTGQPIKIMFRDLAALGYGTCEAVTAKSADGRLVILISSNYKTAPVEAIACLIAHESVHHENTKTYEEEQNQLRLYRKHSELIKKCEELSPEKEKLLVTFIEQFSK